MANLNKRFPKYSTLLKLYPAQYRRKYGEQSLLTLGDMLDLATGQRERAVIWYRTSVDFIFSVMKQNILSLEVAMDQNPNYIKRNSFAGGLLLLPFFGALLANTINNALYGHNLYSSWLWSQTILKIWVFYLPIVALLIASATFIYWLVQKQHSKEAHWKKKLLDFHHNWPMVLLAIVAFGILVILFGHDSVHCFVQDPLHTISHWRTILQCARNG